MKKRFNAGAGIRMLAGILLAAALPALFAACGEKEKENEVSCVVTAHELPLKKAERALDILPDGDGYLLLKGIMGQASSTVRLDASFKEAGEAEKTAARGAVSFAKDGDALYTYANTGGEGPTYDLYKDGDVQVRCDNLSFDSARSILEVFDGTLYAAIPGGSGEHNNCFAVDDRLLPLPYETGDGDRLAVAGVLQFGGAVYAAVGVEKIRYVGDGRSGGTTEGYDLALYPLTPKSETLPDAALAVEGLPGCVNACASDGDSLYILSGTALFRYDGEKLEELCNLVIAGVRADTEVRRLFADGDGGAFVLSEDRLLECRPGRESGEKTVLTIGLVHMAGITGDLQTGFAAAFNRKDLPYAAVLKSYKSAEAMNLALLSGEVDAVLSCDLTLMNNYADKGLFRDLYSLCPELAEEGALVSSVAALAQRNGETPYLPRSFGISVLTVEKGLLEGRQSFEDFLDFLRFAEEKDPAFFKKQIRETWLYNYGLLRSGEWIDYETRTAYFESPAFVEFLNACLLTSKDWDEFQAQNVTAHIGENFYAGRPFDELWFLESYVNGLREAGIERDVQVALPLPGVRGGYSLSGAPYFAAVKNGEKEEALSAFVRFYYLESYLLDCGFPEETGFSIRRDEFEAELNRDLSGQTADPPEREEELQEEDDEWKAEERVLREKTRAMIEGAARFSSSYRDEVADIVEDEALRFFRGEITAGQAAEYIQNRVMIYLSEQG
ncbi:MAG: hypothetical protein J5849_02885 [Clostridia bacterium]|nr:hypothetical protein [Clostridia bacterium]